MAGWGREDGGDIGRQGQNSRRIRVNARGRGDWNGIGRRGQTHEESESMPGAEVKTQFECKKLISVLFALFKGL